MNNFMMSGEWLQCDVNKKIINIHSIESFDIEAIRTAKGMKSHRVIVIYMSDSENEIIYEGSEEQCEQVRQNLWDSFTDNYNTFRSATQSIVDLSGLVWRLINILHPEECEEEEGDEKEQSQPA